jgi:hypothetical protein
MGFLTHLLGIVSSVGWRRKRGEDDDAFGLEFYTEVVNIVLAWHFPCLLESMVHMQCYRARLYWIARVFSCFSLYLSLACKLYPIVCLFPP